MEEMETSAEGPGTTAISTVAVKSGETRIVIALLKYKDWLELKVVEVTPSLTHLAESLREAEVMKQTHQDVITKIQSKTSPVEELYRRAGEVMSKDCRPEVYSAMADSLSLVWENINSHLDLRKQLIQLNLEYFRFADSFEEKCLAIERFCKSELPVEISEMQETLSKLKEVHREMLVILSNALYQGNSLLQLVTDICDKGTLDSRPAQIKIQSELAKVQVERWLEGLHSRRHAISALVETRTREVSQCLGLALITADLALLRRHIAERTDSMEGAPLGDASASSQHLFHEHKKLLPEAKEFQEQALKIVKATEEFASEGHFAGPEAISEAYNLLEMAASYIHFMDSQETLLTRAIAFFNEAQSALVKLDQLEVQLNTGDLGLDENQLSHLHSNIATSLDEVTSKPLQVGYDILQDVPNAEGVKRTVEQIENRKISLNVECAAYKEENIKATRLYNNFIDKHNLLNSFVTIVETYLNGTRDAGNDLISAKEVLQRHKTYSTDLRMRSSELSAILSLVDPACKVLDVRRRETVTSMATSLEVTFARLLDQLDSRCKVLSLYFKAHTLAGELDKGMDVIQGVVNREDGDESLGTQTWLACRQQEAQLNNTITNFIQDVKLLPLVPPLDGDRAIQCLETLVSKLENRRRSLDASWTKWLDDKAAAIRNKANWERVMAASNKTVDWVSKLDAQLYPALNKEIHSARQLACHVEHKINTVLPEIRRAQQEIQLRIETAESLINKGDVRGSEGIPLRLKELSIRLQSIATDYQLLLEKLLTFFTSISQVESKIEMVQKEQMAHVSPRTLQEAEKMQRDFEMTRQTISEMLNMSIIDCGHIINKIHSLESNSQQDVMTVERAVETLRYDWQRIFSERERTLERDYQRCQFDADLAQINSSVDQLSKKLLDSKGRHGDDLASAKEARSAFINFEQTIQLLDEKILNFIQSGEDLLVGAIGQHVEKELAALQRKWQFFKQQVIETRSNIEMTIKYFTLVQEAQDWFNEGNQLLVGIIVQTKTVKTVEEVTSLLHQINVFLKPGEERQQRRIDEIARLAEKMQINGSMPQVLLVKSESKDMIDSFMQVSSELKSLMEKYNNQTFPMEIASTDRVDHSHFSDTKTFVTSETISSYVEKFEIHQDGNSLVTTVETEKKSPPPPIKKLKFEEVSIKNIVAPYFSSPLHDVTIQEGSKLKFECRVTGSPTPEIIWEKDGLSIDKNLDYKTSYENGFCSLTIEETFTEDSALFTCRASNEAGSAESSAKLTVKEVEREEVPYPPMFISPLGGLSLIEGEPMWIRCCVEGLPLPTAQWFHDQKNLENDPSFSITFNNGEAIASKQKSELSDQGVYTCTMTNPLGTQSCSAFVNVQRSKETSEIPRFVLGLENVMARAGQKIKLECEAIGIPLPSLVWTHDGKALSKDYKVTTEGGRSTLVISEAFPRDAGCFKVVATNEGGSAISTAQVMVKGRLPNETSDSEMPSDVDPIKPSVQLPLKDQSVFEGKKVRLDCVIVGQPEPEVIWYHNDRPVKESSDIQLLFQGDRCSLIIKEAFLEDAGHYKVVAINSAGEASSHCSLAVQAVDRSTEGASRQPIVEVLDSGQTAPFFNKLLSDVFVKQGDTVILECSVGGVPPPTVTWYLNNNDVNQSERIHMIQDSEGNCSLKITGVIPEDRGVYTAKAINQQGEVKCFSHLNVKTPATLEPQSHISVSIEDKQIPPGFTELFADKIVAEGSSTKFECIVTGKPTPKIRWLYKDHPVSGKDFLVSISGNRQVLTIPTVSKELAGKISCVAENDAGKATCVAELRVNDSMTDLIPSMDIASTKENSFFEMKRSVFSHSSTTSQFSSSSSPHIEVQSLTSQSQMVAQKLGDKPLSKAESHVTSEYKNIDGIEERHESKFSSNSGNIKKVIEQQVVPVPIKIIKPQRKSMPPRFVTPLNGCIVDQGSDVTLEAILEGFPAPSVTWSKNSGPLPQHVETTFKLNKATLKLSKVKSIDGGRYCITAANEAGTAASTADVVVKKTDFPPVMGRRLQASTALLGERTLLEIEVTGAPTPTVTWLKDGQVIPPSSNQFRFINQGNCFSLIIDKADFPHSGQYSALATNCAGEAKSTADLLIVEPSTSVTETSSNLFTSSSLQTKKDSSSCEDSHLKTMFIAPTIPTNRDVTVSETFSSEKHVTMEVKRSQVGFETVNLPQKTDKIVRFEETPREVIEPTVEKKIDDESVSRKSALDFFKTIIKENEQSTGQTKVSESETFKSSSWVPQMSPSLDRNKDFKSFKQESIEILERPTSPLFHLEPGPPPEIGFIPKVSSPKPKDDMLDRLKKLQDSHRDLPEAEIPSGGVKMYPFPVKKGPPIGSPQSPVDTVHKVVYPERKKSIQIDYSHKKEVSEEVIVPQHVELPGHSEISARPSLFSQTFEQYEQSPVLRPSANIDVRPASPRPSAEGVSMEKLWSTIHKESKSEQSIFTQQSCEPFISPNKSAFSVVDQSTKKLSPVEPLPFQPHAMEKQWSHKHTDSKLNTVWPPQSDTKDSMTETNVSVESMGKSFSSVSSSFDSKTDEISSTNYQVSKPTIFYVAEAHATHRTNPPASQMTNTFSSVSTSVSKQSIYSEERNILPSQAKKIWPQGPPVSFDTRGFSRYTKRSNSAHELLLVNDICIEPGPPPEMGYASPSPRERRQSYVETIEQDLAKDLEKEPSRHLVGSVRTIPPPMKKERSLEPHPKASEYGEQTKYSQDSVYSKEEFKPFPQLEPFPFKVEPSKPKKQTKYATLPHPSKFVKKQYSESDYESDMENTKIKARWTPWDSDVEEPTYKRVKPPQPQPRRPHSVEPEPIPPSKFDRGPVNLKISSTLSLDRQSKHVEFEKFSKQSKSEQMNGYSLKPGSPPEYLSFKKEVKPESPKIKKKVPIYESGYMADTDEPRRLVKQTKASYQQTSQWHSQKFHSESSKVEKKIISSKIEKEPAVIVEPLKIESVESIKKSMTSVPPASPSKFIKGEFRESDYESEYEGKIKPMWRPSSVEPKDPTFRPVKPVLQTEVKQEKKTTFEPPPPLIHNQTSAFDSFQSGVQTKQRIIRPEPVQFNLKPGSPPKMDYAPPPRAVETSSSMSFAESTESSQRVVSMQQTTRVISYDRKHQQQQQSFQQVQPHKVIPKGDAKWMSATDSESESTKKELFGLDDKAEEMRLQRVEEMRKRFGEKTSQSLVNLKPGEAPIFDYAPPKIPLVASTMANKHMTEMTSSFKTKAQKFASDVIKDVNKKEVSFRKPTDKEKPQCYREETRQTEHGAKHIDPDTGLIYFKYDFGYEFGVVMPGEGAKVKAIKDDKEGSIEVPVIHEKSPQKTSNRIGWTSESDMSEVEDRKKPLISIPAATPSPISLSPSIPSLSPYAPHSHDTSGHGSNWNESSRTLGSSPVVLNPMLHSDIPKKPPSFITPLRDIAVISGQSGRFECIVQAEPLPNVIWTKDGRLIEPSLNYEIMFRNGVCRLTIHHAFSDDMGTYKCTATNNLGTSETSASLKVSGEARTYLIQ